MFGGKENSERKMKEKKGGNREGEKEWGGRCEFSCRVQIFFFLFFFQNLDYKSFLKNNRYHYVTSGLPIETENNEKELGWAKRERGKKKLKLYIESN